LFLVFIVAHLPKSGLSDPTFFKFGQLEKGQNLQRKFAYVTMFQKKLRYFKPFSKKLNLDPLSRLKRPNGDTAVKTAKVGSADQ
jgi:hypothetical protein